MRVRVLFFGVLKEIVGKGEGQLDLPDGSSVSDLISLCAHEFPEIRGTVPSLAVAVNQNYCSARTVLHADDEIALLPPVSGGAPRAAIVRERIDTQSVAEGIKRGEDGAVVAFEGAVRNQTRGRKTLYLDYEAYEAMALRQLEDLTAEAMKRFSVRDVAIVHRLGRLQIGETSVLIVVASAHRAAAFDACRWLIDTLKRTVPIWKKEYFEDGAVWTDGEPFPEEISLGAPTASGSPTSKDASK